MQDLEKCDRQTDRQKTEDGVTDKASTIWACASKSFQLWVGKRYGRKKCGRLDWAQSKFGHFDVKSLSLQNQYLRICLSIKMPAMRWP